MSSTQGKNCIVDILSKDEIEKCVDKISQKICKITKDKKTFIHLVCVLDGAKKLTSEISKKLTSKNIKHFISYIKSTSTSNLELLDNITLKENNIPKIDFFTKKTSHIIIDDLIDSGKTVLGVKKYLIKKGYLDIQIAALINKYKNCNIANILGYDLCYVKDELKNNGIKDYWLFGYGMDLDEKYRELEAIKALQIHL
ncbi:Hypoxanthine-guanine phosphoribosyltransferase [hydrothermal vent metagenome]|uniref:Hypoxanthine-guanine phosphoribosyltransferase n=1 Tax=hydrothermal vent metagenome TaxID=652676 RepID=A0A3B1E0E0_9ZZZZ